jgi:dsDNA-binding SOS-regulon protein
MATQFVKLADGTMVEAVVLTKAEAANIKRQPQVKAAMLKLAKDEALANWLVENQDNVSNAFDTGTIRRVTKSERSKLEAALKVISEVAAGDAKLSTKFAFVVEHAADIVDSFRWPKVMRMEPEEKDTAARNTLVALSGGNEELANWAMENKDAIIEAYETGFEKRVVNPKAASALQAYREKKAAEKVAKEAAEATAAK